MLVEQVCGGAAGGTQAVEKGLLGCDHLEILYFKMGIFGWSAGCRDTIVISSLH